MEIAIINTLNELIKTNRKCCIRRSLNINGAQISHCENCRRFEIKLEELMEMQISLLIKQFNNIELKISGMKSVCESPQLINIEYDKIYRLIKALKPVEDRVRLHFPHLTASFNIISKRYEA